MCEELWGDAFTYAEAGTKGYVMNFTGPNPNDDLYPEIAQAEPCPDHNVTEAQLLAACPKEVRPTPPPPHLARTRPGLYACMYEQYHSTHSMNEHDCTTLLVQWPCPASENCNCMQCCVSASINPGCACVLQHCRARGTCRRVHPGRWLRACGAA